MANSMYFIWLSKAWYAESALKGRDFSDEIYIADDGVDGEIAVRWYLRGTAARLEVFDDSWEFLTSASAQNLLNMLYRISTLDTITPDDLALELEAIGIRDGTPTDHPDVTTESPATVLDHAYAIVRMVKQGYAADDKLIAEANALIAKIESAQS